METLLSIGDFSRMTYLSVKALRHYHDVGLLAPASIDPSSGYRYYHVRQVADGQVIRRFRELGMPVDEVKAVLSAPDLATRNEVIVAHLSRMESQLQETQATVASLRALLERTEKPIAVEYRLVPATTTLAISESVGFADLEEWGTAAFAELHAVLARAGIEQVGPGGGLFYSELFEVEEGCVVAFLPVTPSAAERLSASTSGRVRQFVVPLAELAIAEHRGPFGDLDQTYGALGSFVAERAIGVDGPIREYYPTSPLGGDAPEHALTEVCWPVFRTGTGEERLP